MCSEDSPHEDDWRLWGTFRFLTSWSKSVMPAIWARLVLCVVISVLAAWLNGMLGNKSIRCARTSVADRLARFFARASSPRRMKSLFCFHQDRFAAGEGLSSTATSTSFWGLHLRSCSSPESQYRSAGVHLIRSVLLRECSTC